MVKISKRKLVEAVILGWDVPKEYKVDVRKIEEALKENLKLRNANYHEQRAKKNGSMKGAADDYIQAAKYRLALKQPEEAAADFYAASEMYRMAASGKPSDLASKFRQYGDRLMKVTRGESRLLGGKGKRLEGSVTSIIAIASFWAGIFFLSSNITGNIIGSSIISNSIGAVLWVIGLIAGFFWFRSRKR